MPAVAASPESRRSTSNYEHTTPQPSRSYTNIASASSSRTLSAHPSTNTLFGNQSSPSSHRASPSNSISVETALTQSNGSVQLALENVIAERNAFQNENALLWKHLEKAKTTVSSYKKDLDRIRGERDRALSLVEMARSEDRRSRPPIQRNTSDQASSSSTTTNGRPTPPRHLSDTGESSAYSNTYCNVMTESPNTASISSLALPNDISARTPTPADPQRRPSLPVSFSSESNRPSSSSQSTSSTLRENASITASNVSTAIIPPTPTKPSRPPHDREPSTPASRVSSEQPSAASDPSSFLPIMDTPIVEDPGSEVPSPLPPPSPPVNHNPATSDRTAAPHTPNMSLSTIGVTTPSNGLAPEPMDRRRRARESRISLPDEASRYIASMVDSPVPSPGSVHRSGSTSQPSRSGSTPASPFPPVREEEAARPSGESAAEAPIVDEAAFLDMEDDEDEDDEDDGLGDTSDVLPVPAEAIERSENSFEVSDSNSMRGGLEVPSERRSVSNLSAGHRGSIMPSAADMANLAAATARASIDNIDTQSSRDGAPNHAKVRTPSPPPLLVPPAESGQPSPLLTPEQQRFEYKSAKLTNDDLPYTSIRVEGSTIRVNDRGKEVLSFIVIVQPRNKTAWKVEKLYSDVLTLDARVRAAVGKSASKRIGPLPDNKLFKDNAPAKVDQRKVALEAYFQTLVQASFKKKDDVCMFFSTGLVRNERAPVHNVGYKEGHLTKRSKNFGGFLRWKTRYFVLQSPVLEYYESRGGQHLGSIQIANAQIGRQQRPSSSVDDENAFRHAFLIIEAKKGPGGTPIRHVLCAESDAERDSWVQALVRYVGVNAGQDDLTGHDPSTSIGLNLNIHHGARSSTSSSLTSPIEPPPPRSTRRGISKDDVPRNSSLSSSTTLADGASGTTVATSETSTSSPEHRASAMSIPEPGSLARQVLTAKLGQGISSSVPLSSSMPTNLDVSTQYGQIPRASSELGHYPDISSEPRASTSSSGPSRPQRASYHPSLTTVKASGGSAETSPISPDAAPSTSGNKGKTISGPLNGTPIPAGYKFGVKDPPANHEGSSSERERKSKSGRFWGFGGKVPGGHPTVAPRAVFGVAIADSLAVAQIANLPAIVFRCIEYLETKKADQEEGIYRLSGSTAVMKALKDRFNTEGDVDLLAPEEYWDPHAIAGLLKTYFRELPTSILTHDLHFRFLKVIDLTDPEDRVTELAHLIAALPLPNYCLLRALTAHLILIVQNSSVNKMTMRNVGIVFSPTLGIPAGVFGLMLGEFKRVFNVDADDAASVELSGSGASEETTPRSRDKISVVPPSKRNSLSYAEASADRLLGLTGRTLTAPDEGDSDDTDDLIIQDDSGTETDATPSIAGSENGEEGAGSPPDTPGPRTYRPSIEESNGSPVRPPRHPSHSAVVAATRGLQIRTERARSSIQPPGPTLPASPRPNVNQPSPRPRGDGNSSNLNPREGSVPYTPTHPSS